jgi:uncharacterized OB-fold protein
MQHPTPGTARQADEPAGVAVQTCPKCAHGNLPGSRFCSGCGASLPIQLCPKCGMVNAATVASCSQCGSSMQEDIQASADAAAVIDTTFKPPPRPPIPVIVWVIGGVVLLALGFLGFQVYQTFSYHDIAFGQAITPARESWPDTRPSVITTTPIRPAPETDINATISGDSPPAIAPGVPSNSASAQLNAESRKTPDQQREIRLPATPCTAEAAASGACVREIKKSNATKAATVAAPRPPDVASKPSDKSPATPGSCSAGVWALGLCTTEPVQRKE